MKRKLPRIYLLLTFLLIITIIEGFATPQCIRVNGVTSPSGANTQSSDCLKTKLGE